MKREEGEVRGVVFSDRFCNFFAELLARHVGGGFTDKVGNDAHGIAAVGAGAAIAVGRLGSGAIDDGNVVFSDDDAVLAFLCRAFRDEVLFDYCHRNYGAYWAFWTHGAYGAFATHPYTRRNIGAGLASPAVSWPRIRVPAYRGRSPCTTFR